MGCAQPLPNRLSKFLAASALVAAIALFTVPTSAQAAEQSPQELIEESAEGLIQALKLMLRMIPQYEAPVILPNGDILIRRIQPDGSEDGGPTLPESESDQRT